MDVLKIRNLTVAFHTEMGELTAVKGVDLTLKQGEILGLVGESGCGKTVLCKSMLHLLCNRGTVKTGQALLDDVDLLTRNEKEMEQLRGKEVAMIFQDPMTSLNPSVSIGKQIEEVLFLHEKVTKLQGRKRVLELLDLVGIPLPEKRFYQMPYEFSGGMRQRVAIAIALAGNPKVLLADEPTTALDGETQTQILQLLKEIQKKTGVAIIFITHDLSLVETFADRVVVMLGGEIVEEGTVKALFENPHHEYTKRLMRYVNYGKGKEHTHGKHIHEEQSHDEKHRRQEQSHDENQLGREPFCGEKYRCQKAVQSTEAHNSGREKLLEVRNVSMDFKLDRHTTVKVLDELQLNICRGEIVGLIGPSGCGKSTLAKCMMNIYRPTGGEILYYGKNKQIIFQDSMSALNPRMTVEEIIAEPFRIQKSCKGEALLKEKIGALLELVELKDTLRNQHPYEISGGQRQRVAIARAISLNPDLIIADEPIASLDVSIQAQIVHLFKKLQEERDLAILLISHDLPMVEHVSDRIFTMN